MGLTVPIHFICQNPSSAAEVAYNIGDAVPGVTGLPSDCRWLHGEGMERRLATNEEVIEPIYLQDGCVVYVARTERTGLPGRYSAGYLNLGMV